MRIDSLQSFLDSLGSSAWPFLVGGVSCLLNCVNERDLNVVNWAGLPCCKSGPLKQTIDVESVEASGNNRSVMLFDVLGRTRATLSVTTCIERGKSDMTSYSYNHLNSTRRWD